MGDTYMIIRHFRDANTPKKVIHRGLSREQALEHCNDPETHSETCTESSKHAITKMYGPWFDGFAEE